MAFTMRDLQERSGLSDRTIRTYIERGLLPKPKGRGPGAEYGEDMMLRATTIGRMRAAGANINAIEAKIERWTLASFRQFVTDTEPKPAPPPVPAPPAEPPKPEEAPRIEGPCYRIAPLLPGLGLMVDVDAPWIVQRVAAEICERYGKRTKATE